MRRRMINKQIIKDIQLLMRYYPTLEITKKEVNEYREFMSARIKHFSHLLNPLKNGLPTHVDRQDIRDSLWSYFDIQLNNYLNQRGIKIK